MNFRWEHARNNVSARFELRRTTGRKVEEAAVEGREERGQEDENERERGAGAHGEEGEGVSERARACELHANHTLRP